MNRFFERQKHARTYSTLHRAAAANAVLAANGMPLHTKDEIRMFVGNGIRKLIERAVPAGTNEDTVVKVLNDFKAYYGAHCAEKTAPYEGILEMLAALRANGVRSAILIIVRIFNIDKSCFADIVAQLSAIGLDTWSIALIAICFLVLLFADICKKRGVAISRRIMSMPWPVQSCTIVFVICFVLVFGIWGPEYNQASFIYFQF